jgi:hypothetical protein
MLSSKLAAPLVLLSVAFVNGCAVDVDGQMIEESRGYLTTMNVYLGSFHGHSAASDGSGSPSTVFNWAKSSGNFDFYILTDHAELLTNNEWNTNATVANQYNQDGVFVAMRGFEYSNPFDGHANVFETSGKKGWFLSSNSAFYNWVDSNNGIGQFNHPGDSGSFNNYAFVTNASDNFKMMETANGGDRNSSGRYIGYFNTALAKGWKLAPTGNLDNHSLSDAGVRTGVLATSLTRAGIVDAMRARRLFSADDLYIEVRFSLGDRWMGEVVPGVTGSYTFDLNVVSDEVISKVELVVKGVVTTSATPGTTAVSWRPSINVTADTYAYARVTEADGNVALSAPIWIDVP